MKVYQADSIRNIALAGHASKGKTTLAEALLNIAGATERIGKVADGTTVLIMMQKKKSAKYPFLVRLLLLNTRIQR